MLLYMNARFNNEKLDFHFASAFFALVFFNLFAWSLGFYIHPILFLSVFMAFLGTGLFRLERHWITITTLSCLILMVLGAPLFDWDARYIWFFHGKRIFLDNNLYAPLDNYFWEIHNDYPVLVPALAASLARGIGFWNEFFPRLSVVIVLIPAFLVMRFLFKKNSVYGLAVLGVLFISKQFLINGYMDAILGLYIAISCLLLVTLESAPSDKKAYSFLFWIFLLLPMIKNEGVLASLILLISSLVVFWKRKTQWVFLVGTFLVYYLLWKRHVTAAGIQTTDLFVTGILNRALTRLSNGADLLEITSSMLRISGAYLGVLGLFLWKYRRAIKLWRVPAFFVIAYTGAMWVIYLITTLDLKFHLDHSVDRVLLPVNLTIFLMLVAAIPTKNANPRS